MKTPLLEKLNAAQKEAAVTIDKNIRIVAGAGSGKTQTMIARMEYLLEEVGVYPSRIMAITFTNKAAREMKERLLAQCGVDAQEVRISTIHALSARILREDAQAAGYPRSFMIMDTEDQKAILKPIYKELSVDRTEISPQKALGAISDWKRKGISVQEAQEDIYSETGEVLAEIYKRYEEQRKILKAMDFDDLLLEARSLLKNNEEVRTKWQNRLDYIHVDEFQDVDPVQYELIQYLHRPDAFVCVVGDPDQTIYTWRGADVDIILNFDKHFKPCHTIILTENYRSTRPVLEAANKLIQHNQSRIKKDLNAQRDDGDLVHLYQASDEDNEAIHAARIISDLKREGVNYNDMAILYRANYLSRAMEKTLKNHSIPYEVYGGIRFYERMEVKDILAYLRLLLKPDEEDPKQKSFDLAVMRVINQPRRGIGARTIEKLQAEAAQKDVNMLEVMKDPETLSTAAARKVRGFYETIMDLRREMERLPLSDMIDVILDYTGYQTMLAASNEEERLENARELKNDIQSALEAQPDLTLDDYLQNVALYTDRAQEDGQDGMGVKLMTMHAAKGTEYPVVFVVGLNENVIPSARAMDESGRRALEEERRLLYVAMTRAKDKLYMSWNEGYSYIDNESRNASRFIKEIPAQWTERESANDSAAKIPAGKSPTFKSGPAVSRHSRVKAPHVPKVHYRRGDIIDHNVYGEGVILSIDKNVASIAFAHPIGVKKMDLQHPSIQKKARTHSE